MEDIASDSEGSSILQWEKPTKLNSKNGTGKQKNSKSQHFKPSVQVKMLDEMWIDQYRPQSIDELCMHSRKIASIKNWFEESFSSLADRKISKSRPPRMDTKALLLLSGPAGSCKSAALDVLSNEMDFSLISWEESSHNSSQFDNTFFHHDDERLPYESHMQQFEHFLLRVERYPRLQVLTSTNSINNCSERRLNRKRKVLLIEDIPFVGNDNYKSKFSEIIVRAIRNTRYPIVCIQTSSQESQFSWKDIFNDEILAHPYVTQIITNPIAEILMKKALNRIINHENISLTTPDLKYLMQKSNGDLRLAIQSLQFHSLSTTKDDIITKKKRKRITANDDDVDNDNNKKQKQHFDMLSGRDLTLSMFHSMGRILYGKRTARMKPESVIYQAESGPKMFVELLQCNTLRHLCDLYCIEQAKRITNKKQTIIIDEFGFEEIVEDSLSSSSNDNNNNTNTYDELKELDDVATISEYYSQSDILIRSSSESKYGKSLNTMPEELGASVAIRGYINTLYNNIPIPTEEEDKKKKKKNGSGNSNKSVMKGPLNNKTYFASKNLQQAGRILFNQIVNIHVNREFFIEYPTFLKTISRKRKTMILNTTQSKYLQLLCDYDSNKPFNVDSINDIYKDSMRMMYNNKNNTNNNTGNNGDDNDVFIPIDGDDIS